MSETPDARRSRLRWLTLAEIVAVLAVVISGLGLWQSWHDDAPPPAVVIEKNKAIPLALRGRVEDDGHLLVISPVEASHALDSATFAANGREVAVGSDGRISANEVQGLVDRPRKGEKSGSLPVTVAARYVEAGADRRGSGRYRIAYRWTDGGLFGGRELRVTGFSRA